MNSDGLGEGKERFGALSMLTTTQQLYDLKTSITYSEPQSYRQMSGDGEVFLCYETMSIKFLVRIHCGD